MKSGHIGDYHTPLTAFELECESRKHFIERLSYCKFKHLVGTMQVTHTVKLTRVIQEGTEKEVMNWVLCGECP